MAEHDYSSDYSSLSSSLLLPTGKHFPSWSPQQWQNSSNDLQDENAGTFTTPSIPGMLQNSYFTNDQSSPQHSVGRLDQGVLGAVKQRNDQLGRDFGSDSKSGQSLPTSTISKTNGNNHTPPQDRKVTNFSETLAELRMKAKESIMAKKAQSSSSSSNDSSAIGFPESTTTKLSALLTGGLKSAAQSNNVTISSPLINTMDATSMEIEDLLAEGRQAAKDGFNQRPSRMSPPREIANGHTPEPSKEEPRILQNEIDPNYSKDLGTSDGPKLAVLADVHPQSLMRRVISRIDADADTSMIDVVRETPPGLTDTMLEDVEEWLTLTGFHDEPYREKVLHRRRRMKAIEEEKLQLLLEEHADQDHRHQLIRSQSILATKNGLASPSLARQTPMRATQPPMPSSSLFSTGSNRSKRHGSFVQQDVEDHVPRKVLLEDGAQAVSKPGSATVITNPIRRSPPREDPNASKRRRLNDVNGNRRTDTHTERTNEGDHDRHAQRQAATYDERRRPSFEGSRIRRNSDYNRPNENVGCDSRGRRTELQDKEYRNYRSRGGSLKNANGTRSGAFDLRSGNVRFFMIKSWNLENIELAHRECTWSTQTKNQGLFVDAFEASRHVILVFSANASKAFQGYARMQCLPGERGVTEPSWKKKLHWQTTEPFKLRWIAKHSTPYRAVGHLKNVLNEDSPVFVGRDGQEIPENIGIELCEIIEEHARYGSDHMSY